MKKQYRHFAFLLSLVWILMACRLTQQLWKQPAKQAVAATASLGKNLPTDEVSQTRQADPGETQASLKVNSDPVTLEKPPQSPAAEIRPKEMRTNLTHLSSLIGYNVLDENGDKLGVAGDYIVNDCETYIIYILMEPVAGLNVAPGSRVVIPFEAVTINSGKVGF
jgi:sporulation protein YlmC with PRC-barrel domain